ncbi:eso1 [[Candida] subhashii]|uniref:Eso1 n=1 Tax=[Candida] subhashii TaxID=561895 RepID=A0A8J5QLJ1_9ASCO|nr:eso1 [[Candida] subhashii]KAG7662700.1 eso1 [[Candida] subhashii]
MSVKLRKDASPISSLKTNAKPSRFTFQNLLDLNNPTKAYLSPLSTIALVDLNAFFAQVEQIRLNLTDKDPVVCAQWSSLIAVSYAARKYGIGRLDSIKSAREKCPNLIVAHAAVFKRGESHWAYLPGMPDAATHKVSLDPYRRESRKILRVIQERFDLVEKASVDESYIDFGRDVYERLMKYFPELTSYDDPTDYLPPIPNLLPKEIQWEGDVILSEKEISIDENAQEKRAEPVIEDWDDVCLVIGSQILLDLRQAIYDELGYTTSAGLARNKLMAKLAGGFKKPDDQTIIRNVAIDRFLTNFQLNDISGMGGKLGDTLIQRFDVPPDKNSIAFIRENYNLEQVKEELKDDQELAVKLYNMVRGLHSSEISNKSDLKSMASNKNFLPQKPVATLGQAYGWLKVFAGDLYNRLIDLDNENLELSMSKLSKKQKGYVKRPKTLTIGIYGVSGSRITRQTPIPFYRDFDKMRDVIEEGGYNLIRDYLEVSTNLSRMNGDKRPKELFKMDPFQVKIVPIRNMSLSISNFVTLNDTALIETYASENTENKMNKITRELKEINELMKLKKEATPPRPQTNKVISKEDKEHIAKMFKDFESSYIEPEPTQATKPIVSQRPTNDNYKRIRKQFDDYHSSASIEKKSEEAISEVVENNLAKRKRPKMDIFQTLQKKNKPSFMEILLESKVCPKCKIQIDDALEHNDFHIAMELSERLNSSG